ncbi:MAG TPA: hypothetical protein VF861_00010 [Telluria sp.]
MFIMRAGLGLAGALFALGGLAATVNPFADHQAAVPPAAEYAGPLFKLSYKYPDAQRVPAMPWRAALGNGPITRQNAAAYAQALKNAVGKDMRVLLTDYARWNADKRGWYNDPWLGEQREPIHGMLLGVASVDNALFPKSGLSKPFTTYVLTYYNSTAAQTIGRIWGKTAQNPVVDAASTQYAEGSVTVKLAFTTAGPGVWPAMDGALAWPLYIAENATTGQFDKPAVQHAYLMQLDIVVKDSQAAPQTGWVFTTLVYDRSVRAGAQGVWDQMVPLGAQWGNDPQVNSALAPAATLQETWVNPAAPLYATETLGWGGRLSGPNDHGVNDISFVDNGSRRLERRARNSSCLSCHGASQWNVGQPASGMASFIMPLAAPANGGSARAGQPYLNSPVPGSGEWLRWFQNRQGNVPMDAGSVAGDYDLALSFRVLPAWYQAMTGQAHALTSVDARGKPVLRDKAGKVRE